MLYHNMCQRNCLYCGMRRESKIQRYTHVLLQPGETLTELFDYGVKNLLIEAGEQTGENRYNWYERTLDQIKNDENDYNKNNNVLILLFLYFNFYILIDKLSWSCRFKYWRISSISL